MCIHNYLKLDYKPQFHVAEFVRVGKYRTSLTKCGAEI